MECHQRPLIPDSWTARPFLSDNKEIRPNRSQNLEIVSDLVYGWWVFCFCFVFVLEDSISQDRLLYAAVVTKCQ